MMVPKGRAGIEKVCSLMPGSGSLDVNASLGKTLNPYACSINFVSVCVSG